MSALDWLKRHIDHAGVDCLIWPFGRWSNRAGYQYGCVHVPGRGARPAHVVMCEFVKGPKPSPKHGAAHSCGNGGIGCVHPAHVRWATHKENMEDKARHGTQTRLPGELNGSAKLTNKQAATIKRKLQRNVRVSALAKQYGVSVWTIQNIRRRTRYAAV